MLDRESTARGQIDPLRGRFWRIENPSKVSALGDPVAYKLVPGENVAPMFPPESRFAQRAGFTAEHVWVTAYDPAERYAAGDYPNQHPGGDGVRATRRPTARWRARTWCSGNTFGAHHVVRPEDWPVMPVTHVGFKLKPAGFFDGNPALDMPRSHPAHCAITASRTPPPGGPAR